MNTTNTPSHRPLQQIARNCFRKMLLALPIALAVFAMLAFAAEHPQTVSAAAKAAWMTLLHIVSLGGYFWGAVAVGFAGLSMVGCVYCVWFSVADGQTSQDDEDAPNDNMGALLTAGAMAAWFLVWVCYAAILQIEGIDHANALTGAKLLAAGTMFSVNFLAGLAAYPMFFYVVFKLLHQDSASTNDARNQFVNTLRQRDQLP